MRQQKSRLVVDEITTHLPGLSPVESMKLCARFGGVRLASDGSVLVLREIESRLNLAARRTGCLLVPFHRLDQCRHQRLQAFATDPVRCLPQNDYRLADRLDVDQPTGLRHRAARGGVAPQPPHRVLSVKVGDCNEFIENACLLGAPCNCTVGPKR